MRLFYSFLTSFYLQVFGVSVTVCLQHGRRNWVIFRCVCIRQYSRKCDRSELFQLFDSRIKINSLQITNDGKATVLLIVIWYNIRASLMVSGPITSWEIDGETVSDFIFLSSKITADGYCSHEIYDQPRQHIKKQRHYFTNKGLSSQSYGFPNSRV